ncbi:MAG: alpha/beta fold hydrolase [Nocardioides sp.]
MKALLVTVTAALAASAVACEADASRDTDRRTPYFEASSCPWDIEAAVLAEHSCGFVVPQRGVRLFVVRVEPPTPSDRAPVVETGTDLGTAPDYAGLAPIAQRTDRPLLMVALRGTGHSSPSLQCREVDKLARAAATHPDAAAVDVTAGVAHCRSRLEAAGAEPASADLTTTAADLHAVVRALSIDKAVASAHGTTGLAALEWARRHPADLEALILDTPYFGGEDPDRRLDELMGALDRACRADRRCRSAYPALTRRWEQALARTAAQPLSVVVEGASVPIDDAALRRAARWLMAGGGELGPGRVPELVLEADSRQPGTLLEEYARRLVAGPPLCVGYLPKCGGSRLSIGAALAMNCPAVADEPAWQEPCEAWGAGQAPRSSTTITTPTLVLTGRFDAFAPSPEKVREQLVAVVPDAFFVDDPAGPHNVLGGDCMRSVRTSWLNGDVHQAPALPSCLAKRTPRFSLP